MIRGSKHKTQKAKAKFPSELRFDLVSKDWVVIATGRGKRPSQFKREKRQEIEVSKKDCPFCNIETQEKPLLIYSKGKKVSPEKGVPQNWTTLVVPNKYPPLLPAPKLEKKMEGRFYQTMRAVGFCELVVTRDHKKHFPHFEISKVKEVFDVYQERYLELMKKPFVNYVSIFHNHGAKAGASQPHPHSQIITTPLIDADLQKALLNSGRYFRENPKGKPSVSYGGSKRCIYCQMNTWEKNVKKRVIFENNEFLVICPFASKVAFQVIISPKRHLSYFERITEKEKWALAEAFQVAMKKLYKGLSDPPYNFYLHTAPCDSAKPRGSRATFRGKKYDHYHWHWTILPKTSIPAGFEIGTRMEISTIEPEKAAEYLRKQ